MELNNKENQLERVMSLTQVIRYPKQNIYTFGETNFKYKIISSNQNEGAILRSGVLKCNTPTIVTPETFLENFQGFSGEAVEFARQKYADILGKMRILGYQFSHALDNESHHNENARLLASRVLREVPETQIDTAVLISPDDLWGMAIIKIMFDVLKKSAPGNYGDLQERGFFLSESEKRKNEIEILFAEAVTDRQYIDELAGRLREYDLFEAYEDRFFQLFKK